MNQSWQAQWIWVPGQGKRKNSYTEFRKTMHYSPANAGDTPIGSNTPVQLHVTARNEYMLYLNGVRVGRGPSPCDYAWQYYDTYDVTDYLVEGENVIAVVVYHFGESDIVTGQMQGEAGMLLQIEHSGQVLLASSSDWKCRYSPRWSSGTNRISQWGGYKEIYIAHKEDGWESLGYDDTRWQDAAVIAKAADPDSPWPRLIPRETPYLRRQERLPQSVIRTEANLGSIGNSESFIDAWADSSTSIEIDATVPGAFPAAVFDFGQEVVGYPMFDITAPEGGVLRVAYGESLELQDVDTFILKSGRNRLEPFGRRAYRYMRIVFSATPAKVRLHRVSHIQTHYDFVQEGRFDSSDSLLNQIWDISKYTTLMNSQEHLEDCPWREKAQWVVDAIVMGKVIYSTFGDTLLMRKCLLQGARIQNEDGSIPGTGPERNHFLLPDFCAYWLLGVRDYYRYTHDTAILDELWPYMDKLAAWFEAQTEETGVFARANRPGWWCFIDWTEDVDRRDQVAAISFLYYNVLQALAELADASGKADAAEAHRKRAERLRADIRATFWLPEQQLYADCFADGQLSTNVSLQTNFLAIWCGLMDAEETAHFLREYYLTSKLPPVKGPFFQHIVLEVLHKEGFAETALQLIRDYWGEMAARGATTWWETFDAASPHCTIPSTYQGNTPTYLFEAPPVSLCHAWGASPAYMLARIVLGVDVSDRAGQGIVLTAPAADIHWAQGTIPIPDGQLSVEWKKDQGQITGSVNVTGPVSIHYTEDYPLTVIRSDEAG